MPALPFCRSPHFRDLPVIRFLNFIPSLAPRPVLPPCYFRHFNRRPALPHFPLFAAPAPAFPFYRYDSPPDFLLCHFWPFSALQVLPALPHRGASCFTVFISDTVVTPPPDFPFSVSPPGDVPQEWTLTPEKRGGGIAAHRIRARYVERATENQPKQNGRPERPIGQIQPTRPIGSTVILNRAMPILSAFTRISERKNRPAGFTALPFLTSSNAGLYRRLFRRPPNLLVLPRFYHFLPF